jgi:putative ABC transport system ATP-binding protein
LYHNSLFSKYQGKKTGGEERNCGLPDPARKPFNEFQLIITVYKKIKMIKIKNLEKIYRTEDVETVALNKLSLSVAEGEFVAIMGPSGCGKSTLLNILGLLDDPDNGSFLFNGIEVADFNERKRADLRKRNIGFVFQSFNLIDELTVFENVELPLIYLGARPSERKQRVEEVLDKMQIMHRRNHYPQQLSGGQQQRVAVARAVVNNP